MIKPKCLNNTNNENYHSTQPTYQQKTFSGLDDEEEEGMENLLFFVDDFEEPKSIEEMIELSFQKNSKRTKDFPVLVQNFHKPNGSEHLKTFQNVLTKNFDKNLFQSFFCLLLDENKTKIEYDENWMDFNNFLIPFLKNEIKNCFRQSTITRFELYSSILLIFKVCSNEKQKDILFEKHIEDYILKGKLNDASRILIEYFKPKFTVRDLIEIYVNSFQYNDPLNSSFHHLIPCRSNDECEIVGQILIEYLKSGDDLKIIPALLLTSKLGQTSCLDLFHVIQKMSLSEVLVL